METKLKEELTAIRQVNHPIASKMIEIEIKGMSEMTEETEEEMIEEMTEGLTEETIEEMTGGLTEETTDEMTEETIEKNQTMVH